MGVRLLAMICMAKAAAGEVAQVASGSVGDHTCVRGSTGYAKCWGYNNIGQLGLGTTDNMGDGSNEMGDHLPVVALGAGRTVVEVATGVYHTCARLDDGSVKCWGYGDTGRLGQGNEEKRGDGSNEMGDHLPAVALGAGRTAVEVIAGDAHTCARLDDGSVKCWGRNHEGQLGLGTTDDMGDGSNELDDGSVKCWGYNLYGQLDDGSVKCWGRNVYGQLDDGSVKCWGYNVYGQLGLGSTNNMGDGSNEMGDELPAIDITFPTTTTTTSSIATSTVATEEAREEQRKEDAKAAVKEVESATQDAMASLLSSINGTSDNASAGVLGDVSISTDAGDVKVVVYDPQALAGKPAEVSVDNTAVAAEVPADVLKQAQAEVGGDGLLVLSVMVMSEDLAEKFSTPPLVEPQGPVTKLLSKPLVINIRDENGTIIEIGPLKNPMTIQMEVNLTVKERRLDQATTQSARARCAYWDEERAAWETKGMERIEDEEAQPGLVRCKTKRMAIFSVVVEELQNTVKCSTLGLLLSGDALANLSRTDWLLQMPTVVVMCFLFMSGLTLCYAHWKDSQAEKELSTARRETVLQAEQEQRPPFCRRLAGKVWQVVEGCVGAMTSLTKPETQINKCIREVLAYRTGLDSQSIKLIIPTDQVEDAGEEEELRPSALLWTCPRRIPFRARLTQIQSRMSQQFDLRQVLDINRAGKSAVDVILHGSLHHRVIILLPAVHTYSVLFRLYALTPVAVRVSAIILKLLSAGFTNAVFFTTTAKQAVQGCNEEDLSMERGFVRKFWVGLLSAVLGDLIVFVLLLIQNPSSKPGEAPQEKSARLRGKRMLYWVASSCYAATCICYIILFLANVQAEDAVNWLEAMGSSLLKDAVLKPTLTALGLGLFTSLVLCCRPGLKESVRRHWLRGGETEEEGRSVTLARGRGTSQLHRPSMRHPRRGPCLIDTE
ncbi:Rcbtb1 [Symbiodinium sp. CCMP2456]|nr:Rcbtb1 [Symbiodinium sp. CCMP2456]